MLSEKDKDRLKELIDTLSAARIMASAEKGRLCNAEKHNEACIFYSMNSGLKGMIECVKSYIEVNK